MVCNTIPVSRLSDRLKINKDKENCSFSNDDGEKIREGLKNRVLSFQEIYEKAKVRAEKAELDAREKEQEVHALEAAIVNSELSFFIKNFAKNEEEVRIAEIINLEKALETTKGVTEMARVYSTSHWNILREAREALENAIVAVKQKEGVKMKKENSRTLQGDFDGADAVIEEIKALRSKTEVAVNTNNLVEKKVGYGRINMVGGILLIILIILSFSIFVFFNKKEELSSAATIKNITTETKVEGTKSTTGGVIKEAKKLIIEDGTSSQVQVFKIQTLALLKSPELPDSAGESDNSPTIVSAVKKMAEAKNGVVLEFTKKMQKIEEAQSQFQSQVCERIGTLEQKICVLEKDAEQVKKIVDEENQRTDELRKKFGL